MKITILLPYAGISGGIRVIAIYAERLQARGHEVHLISTRHRWPSRRGRAWGAVRRIARTLRGAVEPSHLNDITVPHTALPHAGPITDADVPDGDVVIGTWWETIEWMQSLSASKGVQVAFMQGYETHLNQPVERVQAAWTSAANKIVVAKWLVDLARDEFGDPNAVLVPNSVDLEHFHASVRGRQDVPTVGLMYSQKMLKGCDICLAAIRQVQTSVPGMQDLRIVAFGADEVSSTLPVPEGTTYHRLPAQAELPAIYASCDVWLFGSRREGFGLPILEAMACRTPVIATPAGAAPELLGEGGGIVLHSHEPSEMAGALASVLALDDASWRHLSDDAHRVATSYSWDDATDRFEEALRRVNSGKRMKGIGDGSARESKRDHHPCCSTMDDRPTLTTRHTGGEGSEEIR
jgi:glycosyltransferase involved in cell wall biosynthesis